MSPVTKSLPGLPCPVTATFTLSAGKRQMSHGGGASCASGPGATTIDVVPHVYNVVNDKSLWRNISLFGPRIGRRSTLRFTGITTYVPTHTYLLLVYWRVTMPDRRSSESRYTWPPRSGRAQSARRNSSSTAAPA